LAFLVAFFNQLSGINIILYYAPRLLGLAGLEDGRAASAALGVTNLIFTFVGLWLIDKLGRRSLLYIGSIGYILSLGICAFAFLSTPGFKVVSTAQDLVSSSKAVIDIEAGERFITEEDKADALKKFADTKKALIEASTTEGYQGAAVSIPEGATTAEVKAIAEKGKDDASGQLGAMSMVVLICLVGFIAAHAIGQGTVIWVLIAEVFPNDHRAAGQALGSSTHWVCAAVLTFLFPIAMTHVSAGALFAFFCFMMVLHLLWVQFMVPETKGISLEEMQKKLGIE
jgi:MFS family permease